MLEKGTLLDRFLKEAGYLCGLKLDAEPDWDNHKLHIFPVGTERVLAEQVPELCDHLSFLSEISGDKDDINIKLHKQDRASAEQSPSRNTHIEISGLKSQAHAEDLIHRYFSASLIIPGAKTLEQGQRMLHSYYKDIANIPDDAIIAAVKKNITATTPADFEPVPLPEHKQA